MILVACNAATSAALPELQERLDVLVVGVITPEACAVQATRNRRIGLMATEATVAAGRYAELVHTLDAGSVSFRWRVRGSSPDRERPALRRRDDFRRARVRRAAEEAEADTVILGCTHYPLIQPIFERVRGGRHARLLRRGDRPRGCGDAGEEGIENGGDREGEYRFLTTGDTELFRRLGSASCSCPWRGSSGDRVELEAAAA